MGVPLRQQLVIASYIARQKLARRARFPLLVEIEPLFACNLSCAGCGKIQHPPEVLARRMGVEEVVRAVEDCGAPMVSLAGGEPLIHPEIGAMCRELVRRKVFVFLCTNGLLMGRKLGLFAPSPYFAWTVHIDGLGERHDAIACREGVFERAVAGTIEAKRRGFRVTTNSTFFSSDTPETVRAVLGFLNDELEVDSMMISPGFAYREAPEGERFLSVGQSQALFRRAFADGRRARWRLNQSPLFLDFLEGRAELDCTPWGIPSYSVLGWQRPCYLLDDGHVASYRELVENTDWSRYGRGRDPRCDNCMAHCGYEPSAVIATTRSLRQALRAARTAQRTRSG